LECSVVGENYHGDKNRHICNMIETNDQLAESEDCRFEYVVKDTAGGADANNAQNQTPNVFNNLVIVFSRGDQYFCITEERLHPSNFVSKEEATIVDPNAKPEENNANATTNNPEDIAKVPIFDMFASRKKYRSELTEAEKEIPSFDVTRHERCLTCGTLGIDRFVCKSNMKIWTGDVTKRERNGLAFYKLKDEKGEFIGNPLCDKANFMQTVQDESKFIVRTANIVF